MSGRAARAIRDGAVWGGASALVLALHLGGALWILRQAEAAAPPGLPEPVFVDLAPAEDAEDAAAPTEAPVAPEPEREPESPPLAEPLTLPPLPHLEPLEELFPAVKPRPDAVLTASARPERRPERAPAPRQEARRDPEPQPRTEPRGREQLAAQPPAPQGAGGGGSAGPSPRQRASLMAQWGGQIRSCISRRASAPRGLRDGGRVTLNLSVSRSGAIQGIGIAGSSGNPALDRAAVQAAQRAGRCPRAPAGLTDASYAFQLPINVQVR